MRVHDLTKPDLLALTGDHPVIECEVDPATVRSRGTQSTDGWAALVVRPTHTHGVAADLIGDHEGTCVDLITDSAVRAWLAEQHVTGLTITRRLAPAVVTAMGTPPQRYTDWEWLVTTTRPPAPAVPVSELDETCREEITDFLARHSPRSDGRPFAWPGQLWLGTRDGTGALTGVGCRARSLGGYPRLTGIATSADRRGEGIGRAVTAALTLRALDEAPMCTIEHYSDNAVARHLYRDLGFGRTVEWRSGPLG